MQSQLAASGVYTATTSGGAADANTSGVSWGAVFAGAAAAAALSLILLFLGIGLGLSSISPWSYSVGAIGVSTIAWLTFMQLAGSGVGGYLAGRLRVKWASVHTNEVFFRDTAHGFLTWAVASLFTAALLVGVTRAILSGALDLGTGAAAAVAPAMAPAVATTAATSGSSDSVVNPLDYFSDMLLRSDQATSDVNSAALRAETNKILFTNMRSGALAADDREYLARAIAKRTGMSQANAERRVDEIYARANKAANDAKEAAKEAADQARKTAARSSLWMFVALLLGAFFASLAATFGGRQRDGQEIHARG